jgi:hypothetical protein
MEKNDKNRKRIARQDEKSHCFFTEKGLQLKFDKKSARPSWLSRTECWRHGWRWACRRSHASPAASPYASEHKQTI